MTLPPIHGHAHFRAERLLVHPRAHRAVEPGVAQPWLGAERRLGFGRIAASETEVTDRIC